jgi:hypothetical protein
MNKVSLFLLSIFIIQLFACSNSETETVEMESEMVKPEQASKEINLFEGARLHIAHVGEDLGNKVFFYKESCGFKPYVIDIVASEQGAQMWDLLIYTETLEKRYLLDGFEQVENGLSLTLNDDNKNSIASMKFTATNNVYSFYMEGLKDSLFVFFDEDKNGFDIMGCSDAKAVMKNLADKWIPVTENNNNDWEVYEECRYGSGHIYIEESFIEYSGGGDANSFDISEVNKEYGNIYVWYKNMADETVELMIEGAEGLIAKFVKNDETSYYVAEENISKVKVVREEPCDE